MLSRVGRTPFLADPPDGPRVSAWPSPWHPGPRTPRSPIPRFRVASSHRRALLKRPSIALGRPGDHWEPRPETRSPTSTPLRASWSRPTDPSTPCPAVGEAFARPRPNPGTHGRTAGSSRRPPQVLRGVTAARVRPQDADEHAVAPRLRYGTRRPSASPSPSGRPASRHPAVRPPVERRSEHVAQPGQNCMTRARPPRTGSLAPRPCEGALP